MALAWNPSVPGAKIEDTFLLRGDADLENLTFDPEWPTIQVGSQWRSRVLELRSGLHYEPFQARR